jgi:hypothetical protein
MEQNDFDELIGHLRLLGQSFSHAYSEVTGEDLDVESAIRHYPLVALGIVAGAAGVGGFLLGRRGQKKLPPPSESNPLLQREWHLPEGLDRMRELIPESLVEDATASARTWIEEVLEPSIKEGLQSAVEEVEHTRFGVFLKESLRRLEGGDEHQLPDPE